MNASSSIVVPSRVKVIRETSRSLAEEAYGQLLEQLSLSDPNFGARARSRSSSPSSAPESSSAGRGAGDRLPVKGGGVDPPHLVRQCSLVQLCPQRGPRGHPVQQRAEALVMPPLDEVRELRRRTRCTPAGAAPGRGSARCGQVAGVQLPHLVSSASRPRRHVDAQHRRPTRQQLGHQPSFRRGSSCSTAPVPVMQGAPAALASVRRARLWAARPPRPRSRRRWPNTRWLSPLTISRRDSRGCAARLLPADPAQSLRPRAAPPPSSTASGASLRARARPAGYRGAGA